MEENIKQCEAKLKPFVQWSRMNVVLVMKEMKPILRPEHLFHVE